MDPHEFPQLNTTIVSNEIIKFLNFFLLHRLRGIFLLCLESLNTNGYLTLLCKTLLIRLYSQCWGTKKLNTKTYERE